MTPGSVLKDERYNFINPTATHYTLP